MTSPTTGVWTYPDNVSMQGDLTGDKVEAKDGSIGKIDKANNEAVGSCISSSTPVRGASARRS